MSKIQVKCIVPFTNLIVAGHGYCYTCCQSWTKVGNIGKLTHDNSIMKIWNNERIRYIRQAVLDDRLEKVCDFKYCPHAIRGEYMDLEKLKPDDINFQRIVGQIRAGRVFLETPPYSLQVANSGRCNLKCIMCQSNDQCRKDDVLLEEKLFTEIVPEILPGISRLTLSGNGEVFFNPYSRKFLQSLDPNRYPSMKIELYTNGTMFTPKLWESIKHNRYDDILVSVDAASKETYEKIRKNGNWDILRRNLDFISELRRQNVFYYFCINFLVMKSNYKEMKAFVELGLILGCDKIFFQKICGSPDAREDINRTGNKKVFIEIAGILADPIFNRPEVDVAAIAEYRKYAGQAVSYWDDLMTKAKECLLYFPTKAFFAMQKYFSFIHTIGEFVKRKRIPVEVRN